MNRLIALVAALVLLLGLTGVALAADDELPRSGRLVFVTGGDVHIPAGDQADAVVVIGGDATVEGTVNALVVIDGTATTTDATLESVTIINGSATLGAGTAVLGDVGSFNADVEREADVTVGGTIRDLAGEVAGFGIFIGAAAIVLWLGFGLATLLVGLLMAGLAARQVRTAITLIRREPGLTVLAGLLGIVLPPIAAVLLMVTVIGIPAGIGLLVVLWPAVAFIGFVVAAIWLGEWLLGRGRPEVERAERPYAAAALGLLVAFVIGLVPLVSLALSVLGLGAVVLASWRTLRGVPPQAVVAAPQPLAG